MSLSLVSLSRFFLYLHGFFNLDVFWTSGWSRYLGNLDQLVDSRRDPELMFRYLSIIFSYMIFIFDVIMQRCDCLHNVLSRTPYFQVRKLRGSSITVLSQSSIEIKIPRH